MMSETELKYLMEAAHRLHQAMGAEMSPPEPETLMTHVSYAAVRIRRLNFEAEGLQKQVDDALVSSGDSVLMAERERQARAIAEDMVVRLTKCLEEAQGRLGKRASPAWRETLADAKRLREIQLERVSGLMKGFPT